MARDTPPEGTARQIAGFRNAVVQVLSNVRRLRQNSGTGVLDMKQAFSIEPMDFEKWAELAVNDPAGFEQMRQATIKAFLDSVSDERRLQLQRLQWRVDRVRERCKTPMAATIAISEMMWDAFYDLHDHYQDLFGREHAPHYKKPVQRKSATILPFEQPVTS